MAIVDLSKQGHSQVYIHFDGSSICLKNGDVINIDEIINEYPQYFRKEVNVAPVQEIPMPEVPVVEPVVEPVEEIKEVVEPVVEPVEEILTEDSSDVEVTEEVTEEVVEAPVKKTRAKK